MTQINDLSFLNHQYVATFCFSKGLPVQNLVDAFGRRFHYLRLSLTEACNFRCTYCLPTGYHRQGAIQQMSQAEILRLARAITDMGVWKIRLTGGEPTVRSDFTKIATDIAGLPGVRRLAVTTNGFRLLRDAEHWRTAGIHQLNISIDSLRPDRFARITGHDRLPDILNGLDQAVALGFSPIKINAVLLKGINDDEWDDFMAFARTRAIDLRFIELMRTGDNADYFNAHHIRADALRTRLQERGWSVIPRDAGDGPAEIYRHPDHHGRIGVIAPYSKDFCAGCNRLRITAKGDLRLCLFGQSSYPLRPLMQADDQLPELQAAILANLGYKQAAHGLHMGETGLLNNLSALGG